MKRPLARVAFLAFLLICFAGYWLGPRAGIDPAIAMIGLGILAYCAVSVAVTLQQRRLSRWLSHQSPEAQAVLRDRSAVFRYAKSANASPQRLSARIAIWIGIAWINLPLVPQMVGPFEVYRLFVLRDSKLLDAALLVAGFVTAWVWWSINVMLWRAWSLRRGVDANELQWRGQKASLLWPPGHFLERTELGKIAERVRRWRGVGER